MQSIQLPQMVADLRAEQRLQEESQDRCRLLLHYSHVCFQRICSLLCQAYYAHAVTYEGALT